MDHLSLELLRRLEAADLRLLSWGCVDGAFSEEEVLRVAREVLGASVPASSLLEDDLLQELEDARWLWRLPDGERYRTRMAEAVRLFARLRQLFPNATPGAWTGAPNLVADFRLLIRPRRFPVRDRALDGVLGALAEDAPPSLLTQELAAALVRGADGVTRHLAGFQVDATRRIVRATEAGAAGGTIICAGTGSGKTLAFYLPAFVTIARRLDASASTKCLAIYPRTELLKDQLREALSATLRVAPVLERHRLRRVSLGALFEPVPRDLDEVKSKWRATARAGQPAWECPYLRCPVCAAAPPLVWTEVDRAAARELLRCVDPACAGALSSEEVRLTRDAMLRRPPDVLFTSTEMLNQRLSSHRYRRLLGIGVPEPQRPPLVLLDEVHTYEGASGAHVALLLRRWRALSNARPHVVGLSATLEDASRFFGDLVGIPAASIVEIAPAADQLVSEGAEYLLALRGDPTSGASLLSTSIQALMLLRRVLGVQADDASAGSRVFAFADNLDVLNRLYRNLLDAEGRSPSGTPRGAPLASLRSSTRPQAAARLEAGQSWDLVEAIGHTLGTGNRLDISRTSSQDQGVNPRADVVVATSALEVGFDDPRVGAVLQHKVPRGAASFLQRKGRAGRRRSLRPWTVVVASDYGRDRVAYQAYEHLFSPTLEPRFLPLANRTILRMQATYGLLDWLGRQVGDVGWPWWDLSHPPAAADQNLRLRQERYRDALQRLLENADARTEFSRFLARTLDADDDEIQALLWEPPRALLLEAVPTLLRRVETAWRRVGSAASEPTTEKGPPLPDFVQRTLFGDLLVPEVEITLPLPTDEPQFMLIGPALREFAPGRVSRRFDIRGAVSHWVDPGSDAVINVDTFCAPGDREYLGVFQFLDGGAVQLVEALRPFRLRVVAPPASVQPSSNAFQIWRTQAVITGVPYEVDLPTASRWAPFLAPLRFHTHHLGAPLELRRFATGARVLARRQRTREVERLVTYASGAVGAGRNVALGFVANVDAVEVRFTYPRDVVAVASADPHHVRGQRAARLRDLLREDPRLDGVLNRFQRDWVAEALIAAVALEALSRETPAAVAIDAVLAGQAGMSLDRVLQRMALWAEPRDDDGDDDDDDEDDHGPDDAGAPGGAAAGGRRRPGRLTLVLDALHDPRVITALRDAAHALREDPGPSWAAWLRARFKATLGAAFLHAAQDLCPHVDVDALLVDLSADLAPPADGGEDRFWLTETTLGGAGALEAFYREYAADPRRFFRLMEAAVAPSDREQVASRLERVVALAAGGSAAVAEALRVARAATTHAETHAAVTALRAALVGEGVIPDPSLLVSVHARILRPGSSTMSDAYLAALLARWDAAERHVGYDLDVRTFSLAVCEEPALEQALGLVPPGGSADERATWRYSTVRGLLWARGLQLRSEALRLSSPYAAAPDCDRLLVEAAVRGPATPVALASPDWFEQLGAVLTEAGTAELSALPAAFGALADAVLRLGREPIDTGDLRVHARVVGIRRDPDGWRATFELPEAFQ